MANLIALCDNPDCGAIFESGINISGVTKLHLLNVSASCSYCGFPATIPSGIYKAAEDTISVENSYGIDTDKLQQIYDFLKKVSVNKTSTESVIEIVHTISPEAAKILKEQTRFANNFLQWLAIATAIIGLLMQYHSSYIKDDNDFADRFNEYLLEQNNELRKKNDELKGHNEPYRRESPKIPRNTPCPCGSGKKYKKCCLLKSV